MAAPIRGVGLPRCQLQSFADRQGEGVISVSVLADQERLPFKFLEAIQAASADHI